MAVQVVVPRLGRVAGPGVVAEWYHADGEEVRNGDAVYRFESDNVAVDVEAAGDGVLRLRAAAGESFEPGRIVAFILDPGEHEPGDAGFVEVSDEPGLNRAEPEPELAPEAEEATFEMEVAEPEAPKPLPLRRTLSLSTQSPPRGSAWENVFGDSQDFGEEVWDDEREKEVPSSSPSIVWPHLDGGENPARRSEEAAFVADVSPVGVDAFEAERDEPVAEDDAASFMTQFVAAAQETSAAVAAAVGSADPDLCLQPEEDPAPADDAIEYTEPLAFPVAAVLSGAESWDAPQVYYQPAALTLRATVRMTDARKMRDQLGREWREHGLVPENEDIVLRALARAAMENPRLHEAGDSTGLVMLDPAGDRLAVVEGAAHGSMRQRVAQLVEARRTEEQPSCAFTLTSFGTYGIDEGTPALPDGHAFALAMGALQAQFAGEGVMPTPQLTLTLAYSPDLLSMSEAAVLLSRVKELIEGPYALLAD